MRNKILIFFLLALSASSTFSQTMNSIKLDSLFQVLDAKDKFMGSITIAQKNKIIYSKSIGKADIETNKSITNLTKFRIGSITKMFTTVLVFKAIEEKKLSLTLTIDKYFPTIDNAKQITVSNLLNHRSGIHNFTDDSTYMTYNTTAKNEQEMLRIIKDGRSDFKPDSKTEYSNSNFVLLSYILEKIYKNPYAKLVAEKITKPLGLKNTYVGNKINLKKEECNSYSFVGNWIKETETDLSIPMGAGSIVSNPIDLTKFIEYLFDGKLIANSSLEKMKTLKDDFGMGMFQVPFYDKKGYGHTGAIDGFESVLYYFPTDKLSIAITSNGQTYENNDIVIAGLSTFYNKPFAVPTFTNLITKTEELDEF